MMRAVRSCLGLSKPKSSLLMVGLDGSGKTTIIHALTDQPADEVVPTVGYSMEQFKFGNAKVNCMDMSGAPRYHQLWPHYYAQTQGVIFVVDAADGRRVDEAAAALSSVLQHPDLLGCPLLVLANKQDLPGALQSSALSSQLGVTRVVGPGRDYLVAACCAITKQGLKEGITWLLQRSKKMKKKGKG